MHKFKIKKADISKDKNNFSVIEYGVRKNCYKIQIISDQVCGHATDPYVRFESDHFPANKVRFSFQTLDGSLNYYILEFLK